MPPKVVCRQFKKKNDEKYTFCFKPKAGEQASTKPKKKVKFKLKLSSIKTEDMTSLIKDKKKREKLGVTLEEIKAELKTRGAVAKEKTKASKEKTKASKEKVAKAKPKQTEAERQTGLTKEQINKLDPLELFALLPKPVKETVSKNIGEEFLDKMDELRFMKGFKAKEFKNLVNNVQRDAFEQSKLGKRAKYRFKTYEDLVNRLRKDKDLKAGQISNVMTLLNGLAKEEIKKLKPLQREPKPRKPNDPNAINFDNLYDFYVNNLEYEDYAGNLANNILNERYVNPEDLSQERTMKILEKAYSAQYARQKRLVKDFLKQNKKKYKTLKEAEAGLRDFSEDHDPDDYMLKSDI